MSEYKERDPRDILGAVNEMFDRIETVRYALGLDRLDVRPGTYLIDGERIEIYLSEIKEYQEVIRQTELTLRRAEVRRKATGIINNDILHPRHKAHPLPIVINYDPKEVSLCRWPGYGGRF